MSETSMTTRDLVADDFTRRYGHAPAGVWSAPGRVNLIGEHTDYNRGLCLPIAVPQRAWLAASPRSDGQLRLTSLDLGKTVDVALSDVASGRPGGWAAYQAGVLWAMREAGLPVGGLDAVLSSQVPVGSGLSSSAAIEGCVAIAADALFGLGLAGNDLGRARLVTFCQRAENEIVGAPTGGLDQTASLRAVAGHALLIDFDRLDADGLPSASPVPFDPGADGLGLLIVNTLAPHANADGQYAARRATCEAAAARLGVASLREIGLDGLPSALARLGSDDRPAISGDDEVRAVRHIVTENARVLSAVEAAEACDWQQFGVLMTKAQASQRDDYRISCPESDLACDVALAHGALGARQTGGGFGGSVIALVAVDKMGDVGDAVSQAYGAKGWRLPETFQAEAGPAAG